MSRIETIKKRLTELIDKDVDFKIFGSNGPWGGHQYKLNPVIHSKDITAVEQQHGIEFPEEYKLYLTKIANGGAGPYYDLYSFERSIEEPIPEFIGEELILRDSIEVLNKTFPYSNQSVKDYITFYNKALAEGEDEKISNFASEPFDLAGIIFLCGQSFSGYYVLVVNGEQAGTIWFYSPDGYLNPCLKENEQWSFFDWYEDWLDTSLNKLRGIPSKSAFSLDTTILHYNKGKKTFIPEDVFKCKNLKKLIFSEMALEEFPIRITEELTGLINLDLSDNPFKRIPDELGKLIHLKKLNLGYNRHITSLPETLGNLVNIEELVLNDCNALTALPESIANLKKLRYLMLSGCNALKGLPEKIGLCTELQTLILSRCFNIYELPESIGHLKNLKSLCLDYTSISQLPESFLNLCNLELLKLDTHRPLDQSAITLLTSLPNLETLYLTVAKSFPESIRLLKKLKKLSIQKDYSHNSKFSLDSNIGLLPNLEVLDIDTNQISALPETIGNLKNLKRLIIMNAPISSIPESIKYLHNLELLTVTHVSEKEKNRLKELLPHVNFIY